MSSHKKIDDPFGSDDEDFALAHREWSRVDNGMRNAGIREGLESIQDSTLQDGFNFAFKDALGMAMASGKLQGSISALLSCPFQGIKRGDDDKDKANSVVVQNEKQLQQLLTSNAELMAGIPNLLCSDLEKTKSLKTTVTGFSVTDDVQGVVRCATTNSNSPDSMKGELSPGKQKHLIPCEDVCSNRTHFWTSLENFKVQAETLGVSNSK